MYIYLHPDILILNRISDGAINFFREQSIDRMNAIYCQLHFKLSCSYITSTVRGSVFVYFCQKRRTVKTTIMSSENSSDLVQDIKDNATLSELFDKAFEMFNNLNKTTEPTNSAKVQVFIVKVTYKYL